MLERIKDDECPEDFVLDSAPFWVQVNNLHILAMNKAIGEALGVSLGEVMEVRSETDGMSIGRCIRVRVRINVNKPLFQWTNMKIEGNLFKAIFRCEKLADYCYYCGRLDHMEKECKNMFPDVKRYFGLWLRANDQHPITLEGITMELDRLNIDHISTPQSQSPKTPSGRGLNNNIGRMISPVPFIGLNDNSPCDT